MSVRKSELVIFSVISFGVFGLGILLGALAFRQTGSEKVEAVKPKPLYRVRCYTPDGSTVWYDKVVEKVFVIGGAISFTTVDGISGSVIGTCSEESMQ